jgi:plastocyanin
MSLEQVKRSLGILVVAVGVVSAGACNSDNNNPVAPNPSPSASPTPSPTPTPAAADITITIKGMNGDQSFSPNPGTVKAGQTVSWTNSDSIAHTATGTGWDTGSIAPGQTSQPIQFSTAGTFDYHCSIHPTMVGRLNVTQ